MNFLQLLGKKNYLLKYIPLTVLCNRLINKLFFSKNQFNDLAYINPESDKIQLHSILSNQLKVSYTEQLLQYYVSHQFNVLGTGHIDYNLPDDRQVIVRAQLFSEEASIYFEKNYMFIDWKLDGKSGYRFEKNNHFSEKADVKRPWELGRLQHLPQLACSTSFEKRIIVKEVKYQLLDFIIQNPVGEGVQWACTMDVGIRLCNMLLTYDLMSKYSDLNKDPFFINLFSSSVYNHCVFITKHLEHQDGYAANHYIFNLVGLLAGATYLKNEKVSLDWITFSCVELEKEMSKQFFEDGGNYEGSTTYHCLSAEGMIYATALMLRNNHKISKSYVERLFRAGKMVVDSTKQNGQIPQFGDNDSGKLFKISPLILENGLDTNGLLGAFSGLFKNEIFSSLKLGATIECQLIRMLAGGQVLNLSHGEGVPPTIKNNQKKLLKYSEKTVIDFDKKINPEGVNIYHYPDFGMVVFKSEELYLAISLIANPKMHYSWGHVHNDKLSFDLQIHKEDLVKDPGTYCYTSDPSERNIFRSTVAHNGINVDGIEQNKWSEEGPESLFFLDKEAKCEVLHLDKLTTTAKVCYYGVEHIRKFTIENDKLIITDSCNKPFNINVNEFGYYSPSYGIKEEC